MSEPPVNSQLSSWEVPKSVTLWNWLKAQLSWAAWQRWSRDRVPDRLKAVAAFIAILWIVHLLGTIVYWTIWDWKQLLGLTPRTLTGLVGIFTMHFVHDKLWTHLLPNTFPLAILLSLLALTRRRFDTISVAIALLGAAILWVIGPRGTYHVGASVLIYGLITFHVGAGYFERKPLSVVIAILVGMTYWWSFFWGVLPLQAAGSRISWQGHVSGAVAGLLLAFFWDRPDAMDELRDKLKLEKPKQD